MVSQEDLYSSLYRTWKIELSGQDLHKLPDPTCFLKNIQLIFMETKKKLIPKINRREINPSKNLKQYSISIQ